MILLSKLPLHQQITYRPPTDFEVSQLEMETVNRLLFEQAEKQAAVDALNLRFELEVARIRDLNRTGSFWSMVQAADIYEGLAHCLEMLNTTQSRRMLEDLWAPELGFPNWFWQELDIQLTWGSYWTDDEDIFSFPEEEYGPETSYEEEAYLY